MQKCSRLFIVTLLVLSVLIGYNTFSTFLVFLCFYSVFPEMKRTGLGPVIIDLAIVLVFCYQKRCFAPQNKTKQCYRNINRNLVQLLLSIHISSLLDHGSGNPDAKRLFDDLLSSYNKLVRSENSKFYFLSLFLLAKVHVESPKAFVAE